MRRMIRLLPLILVGVVPGLIGCQMYSSSMATDSLPDTIVARGQAPDRIEPIDAVPEKLPQGITHWLGFPPTVKGVTLPSEQD